jgi:hypothetical protein
MVRRPCGVTHSDLDFRKARLGEVIGGASEKEDGADLKPRRPIYSPCGKPMARESAVWLRLI